jgi:hypothetical protein
MAQWELGTKLVYIQDEGIARSINPTLIWDRKDKKTGKSDWDEIMRWAAEGWELVSVTYIHNATWPCLLYTFKHPKP